MITAQEAKALYDQSGAEVELFLKNNVENNIKDAATAGNRYVFIHLGSEETWCTVKPNTLYESAMSRLRILGYNVAWCPKHGREYIPGGLVDKEPHRNYGIEIRW